MKESAGQPPQPNFYGVMAGVVQLKRQIASERECWAALPTKIYRAFWIGQCSKADRLLVKESLGQAPKNLQGVLNRATQQGK